VLEQGVS
jgi:hypothetical protein